MKQGNIIADKSKLFAIRIIKLYKYLQKSKREFCISKQIVRSGTSVGANVREAVNGYSLDDFRYKLSISLKEACETEYWLELLFETDYLTESEFVDIHADCVELIRLLTAIIKTTSTPKSKSPGKDEKL
jgi:four helix bundle protein